MCCYHIKHDVGFSFHPLCIHLQGQEPFVFVGLWDVLKKPDDKGVESDTIITCAPNELMRSIHNRIGKNWFAFDVAIDKFIVMRRRSRIQSIPMIVAMLFIAVSLVAQETNSIWRSEELRRFKAPEAMQGVAVDDEFFYPIANREIAKYRKKDGSKVAAWKDREGGRFIHLNSGVVKGGRLYAAHSNFPGIPMISSIEIWNARALRHIDSHKFGETDGSLAWLDSHDGRWYAGFAHYGKRGGMPGRGPEQTRVVQFDEQWHIVREWAFPKEISDRFAPNSCSCAGFDPKGFLYATGHDAREVYVFQMPQSGSVLQLITTVPVGFAGQGFAWDPSDKNVIYGISRNTHEVAVTKILPPPGH